MDSDDVKWKHVKLMKLISLLRDYPLLWDRNLPEYSNNYHRKLALESIAAEMNTTSDKVRRKLHTMRSQYTKECRTMRSNRNYKPKWKLFNELRFAFQHNRGDEDSMHKSKEVATNWNDDDTQNSFNESFVDSEDEKCILEGHKNDHHNENESTLGKTAQDFEKNLKENNDNDAAIGHSLKREEAGTISKLMEFVESPPPYPIEIRSNIDNAESECSRDEFAIFGENVANELRSLSDNQSIQLALKCKIMRALLEANEALHRSGWIK